MSDHRRLQREPAELIISRVATLPTRESEPFIPRRERADLEGVERTDVGPGPTEGHLARRKADALRAAGYGPSGEVLPRLSHQRAKGRVNRVLRQEGSSLVAGTARRDDFHPVWWISEVERAYPDEMLLGGVYVVFDDGAVYRCGSQPPSRELDQLLDDLDPHRSPSWGDPWSEPTS